MDTFDDQKIHELYVSIMDRFLRAGWIHSYSHVGSGNFCPAWTPDGSVISVRLKDIVARYGLKGDDPAWAMVVSSGILADSAGFEGSVAAIDATDKLEEDRRFLAARIADLGITDVDEMRVLFYAVDSFAPDLDTPVVFGTDD